MATAPAPTPAPVAIDVPSLLEKIKGAEDMIQWYNVREAYQNQETKSPEVDAALAARETELLSNAPVAPISEDLDLIALNWKLDGTASVEGQPETFTATWLFRPNEKIQQGENQDLRLILRGWFDKVHQNYFKPDEKYVQFTFTLETPVATWKAGEYQLVSMKTYREIPNVPYRMHTYFTKVEKAEDGSWSPKGRYGEIADSGWRADLGGGAAPEAQAQE